MEELVAEIFGENTSKEIHQRIISLKRSEGIGLAPCLWSYNFWDWNNLTSHRGCMALSHLDCGGCSWGSKVSLCESWVCTMGSLLRVGYPLYRFEVTGIHEGKPVFAIYGFALLSVAIGENVSQFP